MLKAFQDYIKDQNLLSPGSKVLVALSGGVDSVVLAYLLHHSGFQVELAHCNFGLRGKEADLDQAFAKNIAISWNIPFHTIKFDTWHYVHEHKLSIQMAARQLRYQWFSQISSETSIPHIAVAHHLDDQIETQILNLIRGTGFPGLRGMKNKRGNIIRPLLFATREQIETFALEKGLSWREDASNKSLKYKRNYVRHKIIPAFASLNPAYRLAFSKLEKQAQWAERAMEEKRFIFQKKCFISEGENVLIYLMKWHLLSESELFLTSLLKQYGFHSDEIRQLFKNYPPQTGIQLESHSHRITINRDHWLLAPRKINLEQATYILQGSEGRLETELFRLDWKITETAPYPTLSRNPNEVTLELPVNSQELSLRFWKEGDRFIPLGMKGEKKISDFFIDTKIDRNQKDLIPLLCIDGEIAWVCGLRPAEPFKLSNFPKKVLWSRFETHI